MINKSEEEIMKNWHGDIDNPVVSIKCLTYNHEKYIEKALDSFLMQETDFPFEIVVHDDASTDRTADIIREYEQKYPHIMRPIYETENQYSKHDGSIGRIINQIIRGDYIAFCEGDDYWIVNDKLQKQYDYMFLHPECALCVHNTIRHDLQGKEKDMAFSELNENTSLSTDDVFWGWSIHTSSYFFRKDACLLPSEFVGKYWFGDYLLITYAYSLGTIFYFSEPMSVYNYNNPEGVTRKVSGSDIFQRYKLRVLRADYLRVYNDYTNKKYDKVVKSRIEEIEFAALLEKNNYIILENKHIRETIGAAQELTRCKYYAKYLNKMNGIEKIKNQFAYKGYILYPIWRLFWKLREIHERKRKNE